MNYNDIDSKKIDLLNEEELDKISGGINILSETVTTAGLQGWNTCCNTSEPPTQPTEVK